MITPFASITGFTSRTRQHCLVFVRDVRLWNNNWMGLWRFGLVSGISNMRTWGLSPNPRSLSHGQRPAAHEDDRAPLEAAS
jgi:hypothetical protein